MFKNAKPILFNTEMVKAILDGRKMQTRRVVNKEYLGLADIDGNNIYIENEDGNHFNILETTWAKYKIGDILYVRETFQTCECDICEVCNVLDGIVYKADYNIKGEHPDLYTCLEDEMYWKPSIFMPKKYARIFLKVTNVRVERLQDISDKDCIKEGIYFNDWMKLYFHGEFRFSTAKEAFKHLWNSTAKDGYKWEDNHYVFVYEFERIEKGEVNE